MHLFQDVVDLIVDQLYDPEDHCAERDLRATSLVSKIWVDRSQHHLFSTVNLRNSRRVKRWCCRIEPDPNGVSRHVRVLTIGEFYYIPVSPLALHDIKAALPHLASFKNLHEFGLGNIDPASTSLGIFAPIFSSSASTLKRFQWIFWEEDICKSWKDISTFVGPLPNLAYVDLSGYRARNSKVRIRPSADEGRALERFKFYELQIELGIPPSLPFLESCGPHLQVLDLSGFQMVGRS